ncbi:MAG: hypothetical protein K0A94_11890 [Desulfuromonadales bacterium]|nr:hypothetical protein [Desulfuromonadales bacterium]
MARSSGEHLGDGYRQQINMFNLVALRASAEGPMTDGLSVDFSDGDTAFFC